MSRSGPEEEMESSGSAYLPLPNRSRTVRRLSGQTPGPPLGPYQEALHALVACPLGPGLL